MSLPWLKSQEYRLHFEKTPENLYGLGHLIRTTEKTLLQLFSQGRLSGTTHTCIGQELCAMSPVLALDHPEDVVLSNHRNHGHLISYCGKVEALIAELMGKSTGLCGGIGGSQHLAFEHFHSNGVQGGMTGIGVGMAKAAKLKKTGAVAGIFIGDGTTGQGLLYESMNLASIWQVPSLFVLENNQIAQTTLTSTTIAGTLEARPKAFNLKVWRISDKDPSLFDEVRKIAEEIRETQSPGMLIIDTVRLGPHSKGDDPRSKTDLDELAKSDALTLLGGKLKSKTREEIEKQNMAFVEKAVQSAANAADATFKSRPQYIFTKRESAAKTSLPSQGGITVRQAINQELRNLLMKDSDVIILGEDLHDPYGGAFKVTQGLSTQFPERVISTPISEAGVVGSAIGLALNGKKTVVEIMFADFLALAMDQIYNHAAKFCGVFPKMEMPLVIRTPVGGQRGYGPTHSQCPEHIFTGIPGITVISPSHRHSHGALLSTALLDWRYPTLFMENKLLYGANQDIGNYSVLPADPKDVGTEFFPTLIRTSQDPDLSLVTWGGNLPMVEEVAKKLEEEELKIEIIVPSLLAPLSAHALCTLLKSRTRVAIIEEGPKEYGVGAEMLSRLHESGFQGRALRIGAPSFVIPAARSLEREVLPQTESVIADLMRMIHG